MTEKKEDANQPHPKRKMLLRGREVGQKICVITDNINNDDDDDVFCEPPQLKRKVYNRESKSKGKVFIKVVTGKNKNGKKGKKCDLETGFNDIDILLEKMGKAETSVDGDSNMEKCNLQVASIHQIEEGNEKGLCQRNLEQMKEESTHDSGTEMGKGINGIEVVNKANPQEVQIKKECTHNDSTESGKEKIGMEVTEGIVVEVKEITETEVTEDIVTDGIVTYGTGTENKMDTQVTVTDNVIVIDGTGTENKMDMQVTVTDNVIVTDGTGTENKMDMQVTDNAIVTDGTGSEDKVDTQIRDGKETGDTDTVAKEVKEGIETEVTNNMATVQAMEREQPEEQVLDKNVTV